MRWTFDLSGENYRDFEFFPSAVAAFRVPETLDGTLSLLVWGAVIIEPAHQPHFCKHLPAWVREASPESLYLSGWGQLTFEQALRGEVVVAAYGPTFLPGDLRLLN